MLLHHLGEGVYKLQMGIARKLNLIIYYNHIELNKCTKWTNKIQECKCKKKYDFCLVFHEKGFFDLIK